MTTGDAPRNALFTAPFRSLSLEADGAIVEVTLKGPGKGNALGPDVFQELPTVFQALDQDETTRVVILRGQGAHFSYGLDLFAMGGDLGSFVRGGLAQERLRLLALVERLQGAIASVARCGKPVLAAVQGHCIGGALDLIAACDIRLASASAQFSLREVKLGIVADLGSLQRLPAIIGEGATRELAFTGKSIHAERALRLGLVSEVFSSDDELLAQTRAMAQEIASHSPLVVRGIKGVMNDALLPSVDAGLRHVALWNSAFLPSEDLQEAFMAFAQKRPPVFQGR